MYRIVWAILSLLTLLPASQTNAPFEADIIFDTYEGDTWTVYGADLDQLITRPILTREGHYKCPHVSPDGRYLAYMLVDADYTTQNPKLYTVYVYVLATQTTQVIGPFEYDSWRDFGNSCNMEWSPDSQWLMFRSCHYDTESWDEFIIHPDGTDMRRLTSKYGDNFLAWGADSQHVYLYFDWPGVVYRVDLETMEYTPLVEERFIRGLQLSPDEAYLYADTADYPPDVRRFNLDTGASEVLFEGTDGNWAWSPDGSIGAVTTRKEVYAVQDGNLWEVIYHQSESLGSLVWLPDNRTLVMGYGSRDPWLVSVDVEKGTFDEINFLRHGIMPAVTPDGEWIVFLRKHSDGYEIYRMRPDGSDIAPIPNGVVTVGFPLWGRTSFSVLSTPLDLPES
jgi:WD40 repeat protein